MTADQEPSPPQQPLRYVVDSHRGWGIACALAIVLGSRGPWTAVGAESASGVRSGAGLAFVVGLWVLVIVTVRRKRVPRLTSALFIGGLGVLALPTTIFVQPHDVVLGWGLLLVCAGSAGLVAWSLATIGASPELDWCDAVFKAIGAVVLLWIWAGAGAFSDEETTGSRPATSVERTQVAGTPGDEAAARSTATSPAEDKAKPTDDCDALGMWSDEGPEGACTDPDGKTRFYIVNGDSTLVLYEIAVRNVAVRMMPVLAGSVRRPARASGTWARVTVTVRNDGRRPFRTDPALFELSVGEARFVPDHDAMNVSHRSCYHRYAKPVRPGKEATCWVAFDVSREHAGDVTRSGSLSVIRPSDIGKSEAQPIGLIRLRDAKGGTGSAP